MSMLANAGQQINIINSLLTRDSQTNIHVSCVMKMNPLWFTEDMNQTHSSTGLKWLD